MNRQAQNNEVHNLKENTMTLRDFTVGGLVAGLIIGGTRLTIGCGGTYIGGDVITNNNGPTGPTASSSPGGTAAGCPVVGVIQSLRVNPFGYTCPSGTPTPNNSSGVLPIGCSAAVTATPKDAAGNDVPANVHGQGIVWSVPFGAGLVNVSDRDGNVFNKNVTTVPGAAPGGFRLEATICGVVGAWNAFTCVSGPGCGQ